MKIQISYSKPCKLRTLSAVVLSPFYMNFGAIGYVIGHEITHGFDDRGRQFDKDGNNVNWWDSTTDELFKKKARCIIEQYVSDINEVFTQFFIFFSKPNREIGVRLGFNPNKIALIYMVSELKVSKVMAYYYKTTHQNVTNCSSVDWKTLRDFLGLV
ncbi:UNVERIFIED_CONTAM: nep-1 [Trichonephila clavipes]